MDLKTIIEGLRDNLLDMSLRNRLLNFKPQKKSIEIVGDIVSLYDIIVINEHKMKFQSNETLDEDALLDNTWDYNAKLKDVHIDKYLQTKYEPETLQKRLKDVHRENKIILEEQGYNNFFLALGFIEWKMDNEESIHKAPLVLVPMILEREVISQPFTVRWNGEEIRSNLSLIYKLQEQGVEIPNFKEFETKENLTSYFKKIEKIISNKPHWKISKEIFLSNFNFKKFVMFKDLKLSNWYNIEENPIKELFDVQDSELLSDDNIDLNSINSTEIFNVMDADSSQLVVLQEAKKGKNLVVEGPPGTGKSQTIVNLIAELMAMGKKILFISEKKVALDVVKNRLDNVGLGVGCLELHGKNSNKKEFLNELEATLNLDSVELTDKNDFRQLDNIKDELNTYVETLHTVYKRTELTPFRLIGMYEYYSQKLTDNNQEILKLDIDDVSQLDKEKRVEIINKMNDIVKYYNLISPVSKNIWRNTSPEDLTSPDVKDLKNHLTELSNNLKEYNELDNNIHELIGIEKLNNLNIESLISKSKILRPNLKLLKDEDELEKLVDNVIEFKEEIGSMNIDVLDLDLDNIKTKINSLYDNIDSLNINMDIVDKEDFNTISKNFKSNKNIIEDSNLENALKNPNLEVEFNEFKTNRSSFFKRIFNGEFKRIKKNFKSYYTTDVSDDQIENDFERLIIANNDLTKLRNKILAYSKSDLNNDDKIIIESKKLISWVSELDEIKSNLSTYQVIVQKNTLNDKINTLIRLKSLLEDIELMDSIGKYYFNDDWKSHQSNTKILKEKLINIQKFKEEYENNYFNDMTIEFIESNNFKTLDNYLTKLTEVKTHIIKKYNQIDNILNFKNELKIENINTANVSDLEDNTNEMLEHIENLNNYRIYAKYCRDYSDKYAKQLIEYVNEDKIKSELIISLFCYNFANIALNDIFSTEPILDEFNYNLHEEKLSKFKSLDKAVIEDNKYRVLEVLGKNRPNTAIANPSSGLGKLKKEISKKRKIKSIRKILNESCDVISLIKPCFMMSPLSIAQYLDPQIYETYFDYIIFDEASQIKIEDAIGAMLRGKKYIVMGDTKQLPPTNFFEKELDIGEDDDEEEGVADNIESILHLCKNSFETKMLKWHYRSRHESLISVSNQEFYNNNLYVFPSPKKESNDLGLKFKYDPNTIYARGDSSNNVKEAENVIEYVFNCFRKWGNSRSLGIGTFNIKQRNTIMDVLEKKLKDNPDLEHFFNESDEEGFFVKNLENIQGDERDIIIISVGYGKDVNNKLSLNFGPLNKEGGERRLNVLITRAKKQCIVFSNFKSSEMHTTENTSRGVMALKTFLYYAENGKFPENYHSGEDFDSPFEESVYNFLTDEGYDVEKQVGCAGYRIDLAIIDKDNANRYILAIECDGATYHSSLLARDRDRLRQEVLEGLGWKFHRIWSTDWYHVNKTAKQRLLEAVEEAMKNKDNEEIAEEFENNYKPNIIVKTNEDKQQEELDKYFENYHNYNHNYHYSEDLTLRNLIETEQPAHFDDIIDTLKVIYDRKATKKFKNEIKSKLMYLEDIHVKNNFYYSHGFDFDSMKVRKRESPNINRICDEELEKTIIYTLKLQYSSSKEDLIKSASRYLGFKSLRQNIKEKFNIIIQEMISKGTLNENNGVIGLKKKL